MPATSLLIFSVEESNPGSHLCCLELLVCIALLLGRVRCSVQILHPRIRSCSWASINTVEVKRSLLFPNSQGPYDVVVLPGGNLGAQNLSEVNCSVMPQ